MIRPADIKAARILIVDDQAANILLLEHMLTGAG
jgi:CheY-like chemotaxis protein